MENRKKKFSISLVVALTLFATIVSILVSLNYVRKGENEKVMTQLNTQGYIDLDKALSLAGYHSIRESDKKTLTYLNDEQKFELIVDLKNNKISKDIFVFDVMDSIISINGENYIERKILENVINKKINIKDSKILVNLIKYEPHDWIDLSNHVIGHAAGGYRLPNSIYPYTNSLESIVQNYELGYRVSEIDLNLTSDDNLALVHDWDFGGYEIVPTVDEWKQGGLNNPIMPETTGIVIDDLFRLMAINKDMFIITDTKSFELSEEDTMKQFQIMVNKSKKYGSDVINRVIPQIYNEEMYSTIKQVYDFPSIVYTMYANNDSDDVVVDFIKDKPDIKVITTHESRATEEFISQLKAHDKEMFAHTVNDQNTFIQHINAGLSGVYTDFLTPNTVIELLKSTEQKPRTS